MLYFRAPSTYESGDDEMQTAKGVRREQEESDKASSAKLALTQLLLTL